MNDIYHSSVAYKTVIKTYYKWQLFLLYLKSCLFDFHDTFKLSSNNKINRDFHESFHWKECIKN